MFKKMVWEINEETITICEKYFKEYCSKRILTFGKKRSIAREIIITNIIITLLIISFYLLTERTLEFIYISLIMLSFFLIVMDIIMFITLKYIMNVSFLSITNDEVLFNDQKYNIKNIKDIRYSLHYVPDSETDINTTFCRIYLKIDDKDYQKFGVSIKVEDVVNFVVIIFALINEYKELNNEIIKEILDKSEYN